MSDRDVLDLIELMEQRLFSDSSSLDPETVAAWNQEFGIRVSSAERGPAWSSIVERAHQLSRRIEPLVADMSSQRDSLKHELQEQAQGQRALKAYGSHG